MKVTRTSIVSNITRTIDLPITQEQLDRYSNRTELIQNVFPDLTDSQREFIMTGITDDEWDKYIANGDENDGDDEPPF